MPVNIKSKKPTTRKRGKGTVAVKRGADTKVTQYEVGVGELSETTPLANVGLKKGATIPNGEFGNVRIDVSLFMPCEPTEDAIEKAYAMADAWVDRKLDEQTSRVAVTGE